MTLQVWARSPRGYGDQSQWVGYWSVSVGNIVAFNPLISASTADGSGQLSLVNGVLSINIPAATMQQLLAGFYQVGCAMKNADTTRQLFVGMLPLYDGTVIAQ